jgi:trigger factor
MNVTVEKQDNCKALIKVSLPAETLKAARNKILKDYAKNASLPGFRPGKVPTTVLEKRFGEGMTQQARQDVVNESIGKAAESEKLNIIAVTNVEPKDGENGTLDITYTVDLQPDVKLPHYKGLALTVKVRPVTDADVDGALEGFRERLATYNDVARGAEMKDFITIDYKGSFEGKPLSEVLEDGSHYLAENENFPAKMAESSFVPGFCEKLIGAKVGDSLDITVTMPEDAGSIAGKEVTYAVKVKTLKEPVLPELNDEFAGKISGGKTLEETKKLLRERMELDAKNKLEQDKRVAAVESLRNAVAMEVPESAIRNATNRRANELVQANLQQGLDQETIMTHTEEILEAAKSQAQMDVKDEFILQEIAKIEQLSVSRDDLAQRVSVLAMSQNVPVKKLIKDLQANNSDGLRSLQYQLLLEKAVTVVVANATITEETETA